MEKSRDDERTCCFNFFPLSIDGYKITKGGPTERLLERLPIHPSWHVTRDTSVPYDPACCYCCRFKELTESNQEPSLAAIRQLIIELYPHIFQYQVWNFQTGRPLLQEVFNQGVQLDPFTYFCHVSSASNNWGREMACVDIGKAVTVCNIAVFNAAYTFWKMDRLVRWHN